MFGGRKITLTPILYNGPGLPPELGDKIFRRFARGDKSRHLPGNGLGLSIVAAVVALHGFSLTAENAGPGCRMKIQTK